MERAAAFIQHPNVVICGWRIRVDRYRRFVPGAFAGAYRQCSPHRGSLGTVFPVLFSIYTQGAPGLSRLIGFCVALAGIWMVSQSSGGDQQVQRQGFFLACIAGVFFGGFFILIAQIKTETVFMPLLAARLASFSLTLLLLWGRGAPFPSIETSPLALLAGVLDAGGNVFYLMATRFVRLDIAVVLSGLYPASTILLASLVLREKASSQQWIGVILCLTAILLITI